MGEYADYALEGVYRAFGVFGSAPGRRPRAASLSMTHQLPELFPRNHLGVQMVACAPCGRRAELQDGQQVYGRADLKWKVFWVCTRCGNRVGCHPHTDDPLGYLADGPTRAARTRAHAAFDPIWRNDHKTRHEAYRWLSEKLGLDMAKCHMGMMTIEQLDQVIQVCNKCYPKYKAKSLDNIANFVI